MKLGDLYDPTDDAPLAKGELGVRYPGEITRIEEEHKTKFGVCPALTLKLDSPTKDGATTVVLLLSSKQLKREVFIKAKAAGRSSLVLGDWMDAGVVDTKETANGEMNVWSVDYKAGDGLDDEDPFGPIGSAELGEVHA